VPVAPVLVLGDERLRHAVAEALSAAVDVEVVECDPSLGDCVMYTRLEGGRYGAFVFAGYDHPVTRGALAVVADRAVLLPLWDVGRRQPDSVHDGYLLRLPRALGFRDESERDRIVAAVPGAAELPSELVGAAASDGASLARLVEQARRGRWQWADFVERVEAEVAEPR